MSEKQQKAMIKLTMVYEQFGVLFVEQDAACAYFQAAKNAPLETRHIDVMAAGFRKQTGLKFMLKAVNDFTKN